jgi:poly(hydroxyalkanoate) granule-associated protein
MAEAIRMRAVEGAGAAARDAGATVAHVTRRLWLAGLGVLAVTAEQAREALAALEQRGEKLEPAVTAPLKRAGGAATRVAERAGMSVKSVGEAVSSASSSVVDVGRRFKPADLAAEVSRLVDEKLAAALERLDIPTGADLRALANRVEELAPKPKRTRESHHGD